MRALIVPAAPLELLCRFLKTNGEVAQIDLEKVIREKNPALLKWLPGFLLRYMKRIVHEKEFNAFLVRTQHDKGHDFVKAAIRDFGIGLVSEGLENIPEKGGCIVACNHPLGGIDGIAVMNEVGKKRKDLRALVNDILMNLENLGDLLVPVNKHGKNVGQRVRAIDEAYASDECMIVFPAGLVSRKHNGKIEDSEWKKSFITKAVRHRRMVIPVFIEARNSDFFYNLASFRKRIGIKANLEMFYLVNETYKQRGRVIRMIFGRPICYTTFTPDHTDQYWAQQVKRRVYELNETTS
jgi:1-acyl-sn-glycerol-3-phosphate acyltransferase